MPTEATTHTPEYDEHVVRAAPHRFSVAFDRWNTRKNKLGKGFLSFESASDLLAWYSTHAPRCCYEILRESARIAVAFDIDCTFGEERHEPVIQREGLSREPAAFLASVLERIGQAFPQLQGAVPLICTSHKPGVKLSFHLKYATTYLRDMAERDAFTAQVRDLLAPLIPLVDPGVYSLRRQMRLPFSHKYGDSSRALLPTGFAAGDAPDMAAVLLHMWTTVPADAVPFYPQGVPSTAQPAPNETHSASATRKRSRDVNRAPSGETSRSRHSGSMSRDAFTALYGLTFNEYHDRVLATMLGGGDGEAALPAGNLVGPEIYWRTVRPHTCPGGETHDSNSFLTKITSGGAVYRACFAPRCKKRIDGVDRLDWRLLGVLQPAAAPPALQPAAAPRHIPAEAAFYIPTLARVRPGWTLVAPTHGTFNTREHTFLSLYTVLDERGRVTHADGFRRVFGVTAFDVLLGKKKNELGGYMFTPWATVFYDDLARWWADASRPMGLPPPSEDGVWKLPCCKERLCLRSEGCSLTTRAPWLFLRQLSLHNNT